MLEDLTISDIHSLGQSKALEVLAQIARAEKKTFPSSEVFPFGEELWRKKPNTRVLYVTWTPKKTQSHSPLIAYAVYARQKGTAWVHKVCVAEEYRGKGVGTQLMAYIRARLQREGCQYVYLWVDKAREPARSLYLRTGFEEHEELPDYYAPGRNGIKMVLDLERGT
ncbi:acyl-CoA N-acyltransferase [Aspergillus heterothallicus]